MLSISRTLRCVPVMPLVRCHSVSSIPHRCLTNTAILGNQPSPTPSASTSTTSTTSSSTTNTSHTPASTSPDLSDPATRDRLYAQARHHRRARLWLAALFTGVAAVATTWRLYTQEAAGVVEIAAAKSKLAEERQKLEQMQLNRDQRRERLEQTIEKIVPTPKPTNTSENASGTPVSVPPPSFLSAAVVDVRRTLGFIEPDSTFITVGTQQRTGAQQNDTTVAASNTPVTKKPPTRGMVI